MAKNKERQRMQNARTSTAGTLVQFKKKKFEEKWRPPPIVAKNQQQQRYLRSLATDEQIFVLGPSGTGKTWVAATYAADLYRRQAIGKIILTRPNVPCGRSLGYFPGSLQSKFSPWVFPIEDALRDRMGSAVFDIAVKNGDIEVVPFEVMRGRSWSKAFILLDEAQNTTIAEMKMFLTRIGDECLTVINGDIAQCDLERDSGLGKAIELIRTRGLPVPIIEFSIRDIVRSDTCAMWIRAFECGSIE